MVKNVRTPINVVFADPQPMEAIKSLEFSELAYTQWVQEALAIPPQQLRRVDAINSSLPRLDGIDAIVVGGSRYSVYDGEPWQANLEAWMRESVQRKIPLIGICYGNQALIHAYGGIVQKDPKGREIGITTITITEDGIQHPLFKGLPTSLTLYTSHADAAVPETLPPECTPLATNPDHPIQVVVIGQNAIGVQPHPEFTKDVILAFTEQKYLNGTFLREGFITTEEGVETLIAAIQRASSEVE